MRQPHSHTLSESIADVDDAVWSSLADPAADFAMSPRLLALQERTLAPEGRLFHVVVRDEHDGAIALATLSLHPYAPLRSQILMCGVPLPPGRTHLRIAADADVAATLRYLDEIMEALAKKHGARLMVFKELNEKVEAQLAPLTGDLGYVRGEIPGMHHISGRFDDLDDYEKALRSDYRRQLRATRARLQEAGLVASTTKDPAEIRARFGEDLHALYLNVWRRAPEKLECFPAELFRSAAEVLEAEVLLTTLEDDGRPLAFAFGLRHGATYYSLYVGVDDARNTRDALYFNVVLANLDAVWRGGDVDHIALGQTASDFKTRLGARYEPLSFFVRAPNAILQAGLSGLRRWAFPSPAPPMKRRVFESSRAASLDVDIHRDDVIVPVGPPHIA
jgi:hypothetical protein